MAEGNDTVKDAKDNEDGGWMGDVQRALALILICTLALSILIITLRIVIWGDAPTLVDIVKNLQSALINMAMVALGFFFGSNMSKQRSDDAQQKIMEKITAAPNPGAPSVAATLDQTADHLLVNGERAYFATLPNDDAKRQFLGMSAAERVTELTTKALGGTT